MSTSAQNRTTVLGVTIIAVLVFLSGWAFYKKPSIKRHQRQAVNHRY